MLYPNIKLNQVAFHQDHCHPYSGFDSKNLRAIGLPAEKVTEWQKKRNLLPNLQFLEGSENESKNKTPLKKWIKDGNSIEYFPKGVSLELKDFEEFYEERRVLMKKKLFQLFELTYDKTDEEFDEKRRLKAEAN